MNIKNNVLISNSNWLFLYGGNHSPFDFYTGDKVLSDIIVDAFNQNIKARNEFCNKKKIPYLHIVFPGKPIVENDKLPSDIKVVSPIFSDFMNNENVLYPLFQLKACLAPFFMTDTHTSHEGSFCILKEILAHFNLGFNSEPIFHKSNIHGDLSKMIGSGYSEEYKHFKGFIDHDYAGFDVGNRSALKGNTGEIRIFRNVLAKINKRLLVFADSFMNESLNFQLSHIFKEVIYFRSANFNYEVVDFIQPDFIISGQAERYLGATTLDTEREYSLLSFVINDMCDRTKLKPGFNRALDAFFKGKKSSSYKKWQSDVDAYMLNKLSDKLKASDKFKSLEFLEKAVVLNPSNQFLKEKLSAVHQLNEKK